MADGTTRKKQEEGERQGVRGTVARISPRKQAASTNHTSMPQEGTKSSERSEQDMQRDKGTHDHMRETGLTVVTRRSLRALADALRQPASSVLLVRGLELTLALLGKKRETNEQTKQFEKQTRNDSQTNKRSDSQTNKRNDSQNKRTNTKRFAKQTNKHETIRKRTNETIRKTNEQSKRKRGHSFYHVTRSILSYEWNYQIIL